MTNLEVINDFIRICNYDSNDVLGIMFYGSRNSEDYDDKADLDLLIISNKKRNYKGIMYVDGVRVEFFEKSIRYFLDKIEYAEFYKDRSLASIFKAGTIIKSTDGTLEFLKSEIGNESTFEKINKKYSCNNVSPWVKSFNNLKDKNNFYYFVYHNLLENIRRAYHDQNGSSKLPSLKVIDMYTNPLKAKDYNLVLPDQDFIDTYISLSYNPSKEGIKRLLGEVNIYEKKPNLYRNRDHNALLFRSSVVDNEIYKLSTIDETNSKFIHYYYIVLEKIRSLYCDIFGIKNDINSFGDGYDNQFLELFNKCLNNLKYNDILNLFNFVTSSFNIDYRNYKILDLKSN